MAKDLIKYKYIKCLVGVVVGVFCGGAIGSAYVYGNVEIKLLGGKADQVS